MTNADVIIVGGGISGIMAARTLTSLGVTDLLIVEKSNYVGGRLATYQGERSKADYGAQYFSAFTDLFLFHTLAWQKQGLVKKWFGGTYPRFYSVNGMSSLVHYLANDLNIRLNTKVISISKQADHYRVVTNSGEVKGRGLIITTPAPIALQLVEDSQLTLFPEAIEQLRKIVYAPCIVAIIELEKPSNFHALGYIDSKLPEGIERMVDHQKKGISEAATISIYMTNKWSFERIDALEEEIIADILEIMPSKLLEVAAISSVQLKRWVYAEAVQVVEQPFIEGTTSDLPLIFAGDAFICESDPSKRSRLESAVISGIMASQHLANFYNK